MVAGRGEYASSSSPNNLTLIDCCTCSRPPFFAAAHSNTLCTRGKSLMSVRSKNSEKMVSYSGGPVVLSLTSTSLTSNVSNGVQLPRNAEITVPTLSNVQF
eukprot:Gregarina_sp_Pseudo_9__3351@NODE_3527_length_622_cov_33_984563_g3222_i0_p2_GENE_NODE_3527_length_622_cov_33_984563_g3222_i0NODE_3527_length_622_cov_33_984563_g3222_i0_p2_ORF_typecomplete_len101_score2_48DUF3648/PF12364_8/0_17DUF3648/PF12364_8/8_6e02_NODE_3527_length_622_cov_33_984563_g3222_i034336